MSIFDLLRKTCLWFTTVCFTGLVSKFVYEVSCEVREFDSRFQPGSSVIGYFYFLLLAIMELYSLDDNRFDSPPIRLPKPSGITGVKVCLSQLCG